MRKAGIKGISEIRETLEQVVREETVSPETADDARAALESLCHEASKHGLTPADVIRSVLRPVLEFKRGCDCPTCRLRRGELNHADPEPANHL
jgi:hypothetical protein